MKITFNMDTLKPMMDWLLACKRDGVKDAKKLKKILDMPDYRVEFLRYGLKELPVCGISYEEAFDFFMHFDEKSFENPRLEYKKPSFLAFFDEIEERIKGINRFLSLSEVDQKKVEDLLVMGLPDGVLDETKDLNIILIVSIGNSMGWPYEHYIDYDVANLDLFETLSDFLHVTAHEIHHLYLAPMLGADTIRPEDFFLQNFAYEGLAVHFNNNMPTLMKPKKYEDRTYMMSQEDMDFYEEHFDEIFSMIREDYETAKKLPLEQILELVEDHYERFEFMGKAIRQYPTYYFGCYMWGLVDLVFGKERLYEAIAEPSLFVKLYNQAAEEAYRF